MVKQSRNLSIEVSSISQKRLWKNQGRQFTHQISVGERNSSRLTTIQLLQIIYLFIFTSLWMQRVQFPNVTFLQNVQLNSNIQINTSNQKIQTIIQINFYDRMKNKVQSQEKNNPKDCEKPKFEETEKIKDQNYLQNTQRHIVIKQMNEISTLGASELFNQLNNLDQAKFGQYSGYIRNDIVSQQGSELIKFFKNTNPEKREALMTRVQIIIQTIKGLGKNQKQNGLFIYQAFLQRLQKNNKQISGQQKQRSSVIQKKQQIKKCQKCSKNCLKIFEFLFGKLCFVIITAILAFIILCFQYDISFKSLQQSSTVAKKGIAIPGAILLFYTISAVIFNKCCIKKSDRHKKVQQIARQLAEHINEIIDQELRPLRRDLISQQGAQ